MSGAHSILSPSSASRWLRCIGSIAACKNEPDVETVFAAEGTAYHDIGCRALVAGNDCADYIGQVVVVGEFTFVIDAENAAALQVYVDAIRRIPGEKLFEVQLDTSPVLGVEGQGGTGDCVTLDYENRRLSVDDLKFGRGEIVYAKDNEQLVIYAGAALIEYSMLCGWQEVRVAIHQPRIGHYDEHVYTRAEIETLCANMQTPARRAMKLYVEGTPNKIRSAMLPGEKQCRWCPIKGNCPARTQQVLDAFPVVDLGAPAAINPVYLSDEKLAEARDRADDIEQWCKDIKAEAHRRALLGTKLSGWKLAEGRLGNRAWVVEQKLHVEAALVLTLGDDAYVPREVCSPTQAEALLKRKHPAQWAALQECITRAPPNKTLVRDIDPRPAVPPNAPEFGIVEPR